MTVADLLQMSRAAHARARAYQPRYDPRSGTTTAGDPALAREALTEARRLRLDADALDPTHADAAWRDDSVSHAELLRYFQNVLGDA